MIPIRSSFSRFCIALAMCLCRFPVAFGDYAAYYWQDQSSALKVYRADPVILQPYNIGLYAGYSGTKICYLSVGEFDGTKAELTKLGLGKDVVGYDADWQSFLMRMDSPKWFAHLRSEMASRKKQGCEGLFLDTLWRSGSEDAAVRIVSRLRAGWSTGTFIANNAHDIKFRIADSVDGYAFENFWPRWTVAGTSDAQWLVAQMSEYASLRASSGKRLYAIAYGDPFLDVAWARAVRQYVVRYGFDLFFTDRNLVTAYGYWNSRSRTILRP